MLSLFFCFFFKLFLKYCCVIKFFVYICLTLITKTEYYDTYT